MSNAIRTINTCTFLCGDVGCYSQMLPQAQAMPERQSRPACVDGTFFFSFSAAPAKHARCAQPSINKAHQVAGRCCTLKNLVYSWRSAPKFKLDKRKERSRQETRRPCFVSRGCSDSLTGRCQCRSTAAAVDQ